MKKIILPAVAAALCGASAQAQTTLAQWTFETSIPTTAGPISPETGSGAASGSHAGAAAYTSPAGNGSSHSYSSSLWAPGDFYQFSTSTTGYTNISISWDQASSNTGPGVFDVMYSTDGVSFSQLGGTYTVQANAAPNPVWNGTTSSPLYNLSDAFNSLLDNNNNVYIRLVDANTTSANGGAVGTGGTDRVDNFTISGIAIVATPEPGSLVLLGGGLGLLGLRFFRRK